MTLAVSYREPSLLQSYIRERLAEFDNETCDACKGFALCAEHQRLCDEISDDVAALAIGMMDLALVK